VSPPERSSKGAGSRGSGSRATGTGRAKASGSKRAKSPAAGGAKQASSRTKKTTGTKKKAAAARSKSASGTKAATRAKRPAAKRKRRQPQPPTERVPPQMLMSGFVVAVAITVVIAVALGGSGGAAAHDVAGTGERGTVRLELIGNFREPLYVAQPPDDDRIFVVEKQGAIRIVEDGEKLRRPFLNLRSRVLSAGVEQGLFSIEFDPDFQSSGWFYVAYTGKAGFGTTRIEAYRASPDDPNRALPSSRRVLLKIPQPDDTHKGGLLLFGPDEHLYIGSGDGGLVGDPTGMGLSRRVLLGKILRIDPHPDAPRAERPYGIPDDNPFRSAKHGRKPEIWAYGLRNPWRFSFDRQSGVMLIGDVGQDKWEEIDYLAPGTGAGSNFGWSAFEAAKRFKPDPRGEGSIKPILAYKHNPSCSVTGGYVSRDPDVPSLFGRYVYGDYCTGLIRSFVPTKLTAAGDRPLGLKVPALSSFGEDNAGHVYATSLLGPVYQLRAE